MNKFTQTQGLYRFASENLQGLLNLKTPIKESAITSCGSGDQALILAVNGYRNISVFDINPAAYDLLRLKIFVIKRYEFRAFLDLFLDTTLPEIINRLSNRIESCVLLDSLRAMHFFSAFDQNEKHLFNCPYLNDQGIYVELQQRLNNSPPILSFQGHSVERLVLDEPFDLIYFSNIAEYSHKMYLSENYLEQFRDNCIQPYLKYLKKNGIFCLAYCFDALNNNHSVLRNAISDPEVRKIIFSSQDLMNYSETFIPSSINCYCQDALCLYLNKA